MSKISSFAQAILDEFKPQYKAIGWSMEYEFKDDMHTFYTHDKNTPKESGHIRTVSVFTERLRTYFDQELFMEKFVNIVKQPCYFTYEPNGDLEAIFFNQEQYLLHLNK